MRTFARLRGPLGAPLAALALMAFGAGAATAGGNLVVNGDFSAGNADFTTGYTLTTMTPYLFQNAVHGIYAVEPASSIAGSAAYGDWTNVSADPTGGDGNVFVADAATTADTVVWSQTIAVTPDTNYAFSYYGAEVSDACCSNATFVASIDGALGGALTVGASWAQSAPFIWNSGSNTSATISVTDTNTSGPYNDFAVDDFSFSAGVPEPAAWATMLLGLGFAGAALRGRRRLAHA